MGSALENHASADDDDANDDQVDRCLKPSKAANRMHGVSECSRVSVMSSISIHI